MLEFIVFQGKVTVRDSCRHTLTDNRANFFGNIYFGCCPQHMWRQFDGCHKVQMGATARLSSICM